MSWVTDKSVIDLIMVSLNYTSVALDEKTESEPFAPHKHFYYNLKKDGSEGLGLTSNAVAFMHNVSIECFYINDSVNTRDVNADNFDSVMVALIELGGFHGEVSNTFEDIDENHSKGTFKFIYGFETC